MRTASAAWLVAAAGVTGAVSAHADRPVMLEALGAELERSMAVLGAAPVPPYFLSYEATEQDSVSVGGSFGALSYSSGQRRRFVDIDLRVGSHQLDNTRPIRGVRSFNRPSIAPLPVDDDADAIRSVLWLETDRRYKEALERLAQATADVQVKVDAEDQSDDLSREPALRQIDPPVEPVSKRVDVAEWEDKVRRYSAPFAAHGDIYEASASVTATTETRWFVNSEGTELRTSESRYRLSISARTKADDGMTLPRYESFVAFSPEGLPDDAAVVALVERMIEELAALREAPVVAPYAGPAILSGRASGVFFHEVLGHRVEGHRQKRVEEGQTFKQKIGERILPAGFDVVFDPTRRRIAGTDLAGAYRFDNQGVPAQRVAVVENGVFRNFLMSREPIEDFPNSNGHGRKEVGFRPVARQSNLLVEVAAPVSSEALKQLLIDMVEEQGKPFGLYFDDIQGGVTITGRTLPNAFNVQPVLVYRIYPDGREELVRGVDLIGTPLTTLSRVVGADDRVGVFNGTCGAESGGVPVSASSPALLVSQVEVQKKRASQERPPLLPPPNAPETEADGAAEAEG